jgi:hypothetical protein
MQSTSLRGTTIQATSDTTSKVTGAMLTCGVVAGPLYIAVGLLEMFTRPGFDLRRHSLSLLSNGDLGWIHVAMLLTTGLLTVVGSVGLRRVLRSGRGGTWGPLLVGLYGLGLIGAGFFSADPALGFPPGTPADANAISWHGLMHLVSGGIGFIALVAACMVFARRFASLKEGGWSAYSVATGVFYLVAFFGIAAGSQQQGALLTFVNLAFSVAVVLAWTWISLLCERLRRELLDARA